MTTYFQNIQYIYLLRKFLRINVKGHKNDW